MIVSLWLFFVQATNKNNKNLSSKFWVLVDIGDWVLFIIFQMLNCKIIDYVVIVRNLPSLSKRVEVEHK